MLTAKLTDSVGKGNLTTAVDCLREGGNPNTQSRDGATAMHLAAGMGTEAVRLMLAYGGDPNVRSVDGSTPLHVAAAWGDKETLRLLLHNGASPNLVDHEGQRAVDVARSEQHTACVDFLKYYTMLVNVGDNEEDLMYTAEAADTLQDDFPPVHHDLHQDIHTVSYTSSDEDNPHNLSDEYSHTITDRLSRLLRDGNSVCIDVTSPNCPYISDKLPQKVGAGDRTTLHEDFCAGLLDSSDSESGESGLPASACYCRSNHCCVHKVNESGWSASKKRNQHSSPSYSEKTSPRCSDLEASYAQALERRMKQKYFPELDSHGGMSDTAGARSRRNCSPDCVSSSCKQSHPRSPCLQQERSFSEERVKSVSPCGVPSARHQHVTDCDSGRSPLTRRSCCRKERNFHHSLCSLTQIDHRARHHQLSPQEILPSEVCACGTVHYHDQSPQPHRACKGSSCTPSKLSHSPHNQYNAHRSSPQLPEVICSQSDHGKRGCCREECASSPSKPLHKQSSYPPNTQIPCTPSRTRSPITTMCVLGGPQTPTPGVFSRYRMGKPEHTDLSPRKVVWTEVCNSGRKEAPVNGSRSTHSVDSGFCENYASKFSGRVDVSENQLSQGVPQSRACHSTRHPHTSPCECTVSDNGYRSLCKRLPNKNFSIRGQGVANSNSNHESHEVGDKPHQLFSIEDHEIVSSNLRKQVDTGAKLHSDRMESGHLLVHSDNNKAGSNTTKVSPKADRLSASSADTFRTCEEASEPDLDSTVYPVGSSVGFSSSQRHSKTPPVLYSQNKVSKKTHFSAVAAADQEGPSQSSFDHKTEVSPTESLGFRISHLAGNHCQSGKEGTPVIKDVNHRASSDAPRNQKTHSVTTRNSQSSRHSWLPPATHFPDDSDLMTSDSSFMMKTDNQVMMNSNATAQSSNVSKWLESLTVCSERERPKEIKVNRHNQKRLSDESFVSSVASSVKEVIYRDKENGIALLERHIPSDYSGSSGRLSIESAVSLDTEQTVSYDWSDFVINDSQTSTGSSSSFDITAGQTMNSQDTLRDVHLNSFDDDSDNKGKDWQKKEKKHIPSQKKKELSESKPDSTQVSTPKPTASVDSSANCSDGEDTLPIPPELAAMSNEAIFQSLKDFGEDPGPVQPSTRQTYLHRLASLRSGKCSVALSTCQPGYSQELNCLLSGSLDTEDQARAELEMVSQFQAPDGRTWREGTIKSCFNYLLLDPRVTKNLPLRAKTLNDMEAFKVFLSAVFYIGKGKRSRPYCHLYEAISHLQSPKPKVSQKVQKILDIWSSGVGVVSLHCFQNVIPVEAYTREACMVDAIGLGRLTNVKKGDYYGVASTWPTSRRRCMGAYLMHKAYHIFLSEGERQICPLDIQKGK